MCCVVEDCFQNSEEVVAFNASFFLLISLYLATIFCCVISWQTEDIGEYVISSIYGNELVGKPDNTNVAYSCKLLSSKDSWLVFVFILLLKIGDELSLCLLISFSWEVGVCEYFWLTTCSSSSYNVFACLIVCTYGVGVCSTLNFEITPKGS